MKDSPGSSSGRTSNGSCGVDSGSTTVLFSAAEVEVLLFVLNERVKRLADATRRMYYSRGERPSQNVYEFVRMVETIRVRLLDIKATAREVEEHDF